MRAFGLLEEAGVPGGKPWRHREKHANSTGKKVPNWIFLFRGVGGVSGGRCGACVCMRWCLALSKGQVKTAWLHHSNYAAYPLDSRGEASAIDCTGVLSHTTGWRLFVLYVHPDAEKFFHSLLKQDDLAGQLWQHRFQPLTSHSSASAPWNRRRICRAIILRRFHYQHFSPLLQTKKKEKLEATVANCPWRPQRTLRKNTGSELEPQR